MSSRKIDDELLARARALHASTIVADLHADTFLAVRYRGADIARRHRAPIGWAPFMLHCDLPRWHEGGIKAQGLGVVATKIMTRRPRDHARETIELMHRTIAANADRIALARDPDELERIAASGRLAAFIGIEGAHMYGGDVRAVAELHERGVRYVTLCHFFENELVASSNTKRPTVRGLTSYGKEVIGELNRLGALVDLAHVHEASFDAALEASRAPVIVSHTGCRALRDHWRNVSDAQIKNVAAKGGVIGIMFFPWFLSRNPFVGVERVADHIEHVATTAGAEHVALGSDWDGFVWMPRGLPDASALPRLTAELLRRGFTDDQLRGILGGNFVKTWRRAAAMSESPKSASCARP